MRLTRGDIYNLVGIVLFILGMFLLWYWRYSKTETTQKKQSETENKFKQVLDQLIWREPSAEELANQSPAAFTALDLPYNICYYADRSDVSRWQSSPSDVTGSSSIVRQTRAVPSKDACEVNGGVTSPQYDLPPNNALTNSAFHSRADEIITLFLQSLYPGITVSTDTIIKNMTYSAPKWFLSVAAVYRNTANIYNLLVNRFEVTAMGTLRNEPSQSLTVISGTFEQRNQRNKTVVADVPIRFLLLSVRSTGTNTLEVYNKPMYEELLATVQLANGQSDFRFVQIPSTTTQLFLNVKDSGTVIFDILSCWTFPVSAAPTQVNLKNMIFKLTTFNPLMTATLSKYKEDNDKNFYFRPIESEIRVGRLRKYDPEPGANAPEMSTLQFKRVLEAMNRGDMTGAYVIPQLTSDKIDCQYYSDAEGKTWVAQYLSERDTQGKVRNPYDPTEIIGNADLYWRNVFKYAFSPFEEITQYTSVPNTFTGYTVKYFSRNNGANVLHPITVRNGPGGGVDFMEQCKSVNYPPGVQPPPPPPPGTPPSPPPPPPSPPETRNGYGAMHNWGAWSGYLSNPGPQGTCCLGVRSYSKQNNGRVHCSPEFCSTGSTPTKWENSGTDKRLKLSGTDLYLTIDPGSNYFASVTNDLSTLPSSKDLWWMRTSSVPKISLNAGDKCLQSDGEDSTYPGFNFALWQNCSSFADDFKWYYTP